MTILGADDEGKLRALLDSLGYDLEPSILIGGWATNARVGGEISHDIDLIITEQSLRQRLPERLTEYSENALHSGGKKARGNADGVHVDAYFPHESKLGNKLRLDVAVLTNYVDPNFKVEGWFMLTLDAHIATKIAALIDRHSTEKGKKDARELVALIDKGGDAEKVIEVLIAASDGPKEDVVVYIRTMFELLPKLAGLNQKQRRHYADLAREWSEEARRQTGGFETQHQEPTLPPSPATPPVSGTKARRNGSSRR
ncbi:Nucleotidyl transferase AbiEii toxin, Type IV TA system [Agreia bicolorata]|uniref:Nucleotidyl transferase AbiEii toxin, Type IV TA system n=1 Tax=Agreia bicolorata TaxID=110935 RepID=A0A1T4Y1P1_9MICO|nr:nucleotidyl transferase AbiEii/AbiGii toxin family protein [Agreia bicolorata]SKA95709.1 Nucleotidyl transferase AbiEii toxin, Type IV TA system [Agreia bicolorata]